MATTKKKTVKKSTAKKAVNKVVKKAVKKQPVKKQPVKKQPVKKQPVKKKATKKAVKKTSTGENKIKVTLEQRHKMICEAAYYISLEKTYETVNPTEDWLQAESFISQICTVHAK